MRKRELLEAYGILTRMLAGLLRTVGGPMIGRHDSDLRRAVGDLVAKGQQLIANAQLPAPLLRAFTLAVNSGATFESLERLRIQLVAEKPEALAAIAVDQLGVRFTLGQQARLISLTQFVSRRDADVILKRVNLGFDPAEEDAGDLHDSGTYQALIGLHGAVVRDLVDRSMLLPQIVPYDSGHGLPALALANRLYPDDMRDNTDRSNELWKENKVVHPAFMPRTGVSLSK